MFVPWHDCNDLQLPQSVLENRTTTVVKLLEEAQLLSPSFELATTLLGYIGVERAVSGQPPMKKRKAV
jgi:hypothetical protein